MRLSWLGKTMTGYVFLVLFCVNLAFAADEFFIGHYEGYGIPPPIVEDAQVKAVETLYFPQIVDHYDPTNTNRWSQRYYVNTQYFNNTEGTTVFLLIGGEGQAAIQWMSAGSWIQLARKYGALLLQLEHRFYGVSHPFSNLNTANLRYLSSQQALEDVASFITAMNNEYSLPEDTNWIVFGGSYSASLATWARYKYPHLVHGAVASSGPLFAKLDFYEYLDVVVAGVATHSQKCVDTVRTAFTQLEYFIANPQEENVTALFNLCLDINISANRIDNNIGYLFERLGNVIAGVVQYSGIAGQTTISTICNILTNESTGREIDRLAALYRAFYPSSCLNYRFQALIDSLSRTTITASGNMRQWYYQTCTEYGWYQSTTQKDQVFGGRNPAEFFTQICSLVFGPTFNDAFISEQNDRINRYFGGFDADVPNVIHVHGSLDPWYPMGLRRTDNPNSTVIFINGTSHCADMYPVSTANDPYQLTAARAEIDRLIGIWLGRNKSSAITIHLSIIALLISLLAKIF